jgi:hypothetical protein
MNPGSGKHRKGKKQGLEPTGIEAIDRFAALPACAITDYIQAVSAYVRESRNLKAGPTDPDMVG